MFVHISTNFQTKTKTTTLVFPRTARPLARNKNKWPKLILQLMMKSVLKLLLMASVLPDLSSGYDGPVSTIYHEYPGSQSFVNINFNEPGHKQVWLRSD